MPMFKTLDIVIAELIDQHSSVDLFVCGSLYDYLMAIYFRALSLMMPCICISLSFAWVCFENRYSNELMHSQFVNGAGLCHMSKSRNICFFKYILIYFGDKFIIFFKEKKKWRVRNRTELMSCLQQSIHLNYPQKHNV